MVYCTICGIKITAKNRISYRPNSCRDCELERKRLYSLKKRSTSTKSASKATTIKTTKKKTAVKSKVKATKKPTLDKEKLRKQKEREREKLKKEREKEKLRKEREREKLKKEREREKLRKERERDKAKKLKEKEKLQKQKEREKLRKQKERERDKVRKQKEKEKLRKEKERERERLRKEKEEEKLRKLKEKEEAKKAKEEERKAKKKAKKRAQSLNLITAIPDYILNQKSAKVKKRTLADKRASAKQIVKSDGNIIEEVDKGDIPRDERFNPYHDSGEILRAPSDTPWEGANFKVVEGSFLSHTEQDSLETKGPSEEEVKQIIEKIRLEHKTRKS